VALAVVALLVTLLALEGVVRIALPQDPAFFDGAAIKRPSSRPGLRNELIPGGHTDNYVGVPVSVNRLGLRDRELDVPKPAGTVRLLGVGDSVTFGYGVRLEDTYLKVLEARLHTRAPSGVRYEVVNAGVEECGLDAYLDSVRVLSPVLEPDLVLVGVVLNDIQRYDRGAPAVGEAGLPRRLHGALLRRSQLYLGGVLATRSLLYRLRILDVSDLFGSPLRALRAADPSVEPAWASSLDVLARLVELTRARGLGLVLVLFPLEVQLDAAAIARYQADYGVTVPVHALEGEPQRRLTAFAAARDVPVIDLLPVLRAAGGTDLYLRTGKFRFDPVHPSPRGHRLVGEAIHRALIERRLLH
jgi:lysophospholipase L1-like esterase